MTAQPWQPAKYPGRVDDVIVTSDGPQRITLEVPVAPFPGPVVPRYQPAQVHRRPSLAALLRRPSRVAQLKQLLARYRWVNDGLRERLAELDDELGQHADRHAALIDCVADLLDDEARTLGHAHPAIVRGRAILDEARR